MCEAADRLRSVVMEEDGNSIEVLENGTLIAKVAVTVDGTWQRRGHCSKIGVVFVLSAVMGEVLDYEAKSLTCTQCVSHKAAKTTEQFNQWYEEHKPTYEINHQGSSDSTESDGACEIFVQSLSKHGLKYTTFIGDGDTGCFGKVQRKLSEVYGLDYIVVKEECMDHVQKPMGYGLREYKRKKRGIKLPDGKTAGGKGKLTDVIIDKIQN